MYEYWAIVRDIGIIIWLFYTTYAVIKILNRINFNRHNNESIKEFYGNVTSATKTNKSMDLLSPELIPPSIKSPPKMSQGFGRVEKNNG